MIVSVTRTMVAPCESLRIRQDGAARYYPQSCTREVADLLTHFQSLVSSLRVRHVLGFDEGVEFFGAYETEFDGGFAEADVGVMGGFGDLGCGVVADFGG